MPSFDVVSRTDMAEVDNAVNGAAREIATHYDKLAENYLTMIIVAAIRIWPRVSESMA